MKSIEVFIPAVIDIEDTQEHSNDQERITATMRSSDRTTNYAHNSFLVPTGEDPEEKILSAFGAVPNEQNAEIERLHAAIANLQEECLTLKSEAEAAKLNAGGGEE